jgi:PIN domain nuclease of toxin-antitoxin system
VNILLDTCAFLWLTNDAPELSQTARTLFRDIGNRVYLSSVSVWEIIVKHQLGKLPLPDNAETFIQRQCQMHFIESLPLDTKAVYCLSNLPNHHRDPFDRMLICQAIAHDLTILSDDRAIVRYPVSTIW